LRLGGIVDTSTVDWYGNVSLVVFMAGCNFRCPYCQNSALLPLNSGEEVDLNYIRRRIEVNMSPVPQLDAVVISGGEPTLQPEAVKEVAKLARGFGLKVMLDTNGSLPDVVETLLSAGIVDRVALDVKAPLISDEYRRVAGLSGDAGAVVEGVARTLDLCERYGVEVEARTTVAPTVSDSKAFIGSIAKSIEGRCDSYYLQQFDNTGEVLSPELKALEPPSREKLVELAGSALREGVRDVCIKTRKGGLERIG
jgi:pyruvate formate lyase activating enzyme